MARPLYEPTPADRNTVKALAAAGTEQKIIARCIGLAGVDEKTLRKHFRRELDVTRYEVTATAMAKLLAKINEGDLGSICFWMKCRGGWSERIGIDHSGEIEVTVGKRLIGVSEDEI